jgi:hypothetical protein
MGTRALSVAIAVIVTSAFALATTGNSAPKSRIFEPGDHLGGVRLGMTRKQVLAEWGERHGVCRNCRQETWYFNYEPFTPEGTGVVFERGRVVHAFTVWQPDGWRTREGLRLGDPSSGASLVYGSLDRRRCTSYHALLHPGHRAQSVFYVFRDAIWGFGLTKPDASPCL